MLNYLTKSRQGQFLVIGVLFTILGYVFIPINLGYSTILFYIAIFFLGFYAAKDAVVETIQDCSPNVDLLMILAALGAVMINYESEGAALLLIFAAAEVLEDYATDKSTSAISELMAQVPETAQVLKDNGEVITVPTKYLQIGDQVVVSKGAQIPIDGLIDRAATINEAALTGESVPVDKNPNQEVFAGTINEGNAFHLEVIKSDDETVFSNIIRMVEEAQNKPSRISKFIDRIESKYVMTVLIIVPIFIFILYSGIGLSFEESFYRGMVLLTVASPCALVASATPATLSAISNGAKNGVLFKGGAAMEALSTMDTLYTDKTGTLTFGEFRVINYELDDSLLKEVIYMEQQSSHPIGRAIVAEFPELDLNQVNQQEPVEEIAGSGIKKGDIRVGKPSVFSEFKHYQNFQRILKEGNTTIFVAKGQDIVGYFSLSDQIRPQAVKAVRSFQQEGINVSLLTGDNKETAAKVAQTVKIDHFIASMLPEDKIEFIVNSQNKEEVVGMIGDGINDAPALANADIGIAMGSGSSVAMESSDVVIVKNDLSKLFYSYKISKKLNQIIMQNVIFSIAVIVTLIILNMFGVLGLPLAVLFHEGSTILVILNGLRLLGSDHSDKGYSDSHQTA
ncbi:heavy metal translocating P-type ATPase [Alkalibacterium olivapovliticus]|uniref:Cd2+/Zn2+-exporting ATPase n=1 Tax=Alkalibacterium olivapovliticus TaxID=99907 RepID=A0A2T0W7Y6_9LACT|nr:heavy metal translocating P-type ATPase [Alkalibacterium olivapovliticus]PRY82644.1 Cd2+/Zn2+-exporting ATPase [Alkalibacterium olivapovliticus]